MTQAKYGTTVEILGGNNEYRIGANSLLIEHNEPGRQTGRIMIDVGSMFAPNWSAYDAVMPDLSDYFENPYKKASKLVDALFITHCHEDHIGALVYLATAKYKLPKIYTSDYTKGIILSQMQKYNIPQEYIPEIETVRQGQNILLGDNMTVSPFNVSHSTKEPLGFYVQTTLNGKFNAGNLFMGDYHLGKVPFGQGFDQEEFKDFISDKQVTSIFMDATSATMPSEKVVTFDQAVANVEREFEKHAEKQFFIPVIARSVQNFGIFLKAAKNKGRTVLIAGAGLRDSINLLKTGLKNNDPKLLDRFGIKEGESFDFNDLIKVYENTADIERYLNKYDYPQRCIIISGAFDEDKDGRKSCLRLMSEQNKVSYDASGKMKGKGMSGHPQFTVDDRTAVGRFQRPIDSINGADYPVTNARLRALGAVVIENGDTIDQIYQRTGHATKNETLTLCSLIINHALNSKELKTKKQQLHAIAIHGDQEQIKALNDLLSEKDILTTQCCNTDKIQTLEGKVEKIEGLPFEAQTWIGIEKHSLNGHGVDNVFIVDLCDQNFVKIDNLHTILNMNTSANPHDKKKNGDRIDRALEAIMALEEKEGIRISNSEIRSRIRGSKKGYEVETYSYEEMKAKKEEKLKSKQLRRCIRRGRGGR